MSASLSGLASTLISDLGYGGLAVGLFVDSFGFPVPSEVLIPLAVVGAERGQLALWAVVAVSVGAQVAGATVSYLIGRWAGLAAVRRFGRFVLVSTRHLDRAERVFARHGAWMAAAGRCVPVVRGLIGFPAGAASMPFRSFVAWSALGVVVWTAILVGLGEALSSDLAAIDRVFTQLAVAVVAMLVAALALGVLRARLRRRARQRSGPQAASRHPVAAGEERP